MAEKSSKLIEEIRMIDTDSTEDLTTGDTALERRSDNNDALTTTETLDVSTSGGDTTDEDVILETEQLREQIEETRRGMGETIDAIQEKLSFSNISDQVQAQVSEQINGAVESAKDAFYGKAGEIVNTVSRGFKEIGKTDLAKKAQQNPTALALIGAGVGALLVTLFIKDNKKSKRKAVSYNYDYDSSDDQVRYTDSNRRELKSSGRNDSGESTRNRIGETASSVLGTVSGAASTTLDGVSGAASTAYEGVTSAAGSAYESLGSAASKTYQGIGSVAGKTYEGVGSVASKTYKGASSAAGFAYDKAGDLGGQVKINYDHYIEENPLAVGAVAVALGAAVGFAIPLTRKENEYLGEYRDSVVEKAQATAQDALGTVKQMATEAQKVITEEVKSKTA
jgi:ElaB/YqjD/DUF883 family membrane-anchored ribosome-binding protein